MPRPARLPIELAIAPFSIDEARRFGVGERRLRAADLHARFHGVRTTSPPRDLLDRCFALAPVMSDDQFFSHTTAARLWGIPLPLALERDDRLHVGTHRREPVRRGVIGHRVSIPRDIRLLHSLRVAAPSDAWCELASIRQAGRPALSIDDMIAAGDRLEKWRDPIATIDEIDRALRRFTRARGVGAARMARAELASGSASPRETGLRLLVTRARAGYPYPEPNGEIRLSTGARTWGDLVFRTERVVLEYDGGQHRESDRQFHRDVDRLNDLARDGWIVIRIHKNTSPEQTLAWLDSALRSRGWRP